jgi:hypothetical protein
MLWCWAALAFGIVLAAAKDEAARVRRAREEWSLSPETIARHDGRGQKGPGQVVSRLCLRRRV